MRGSGKEFLVPTKLHLEEEDAFLNRDEDDDDGNEDDIVIPRPSRSNEQKKVDKLLKMTLKQWAQLLRKKEFDYDDTIRTRITNFRTQGKKFKEWIVETKDIADGDLGEIEFELMLELAKKEKWFTDAISKFQKKTFS